MNKVVILFLIGQMFLYFSGNSDKSLLYIASNNKVMEFDTGSHVIKQTIDIEYPLKERNSETSRDFTLSNGELCFYNGTFTPFLSIYNLSKKDWSHYSYKSWNTRNNVTFGGITSYRHYLYVTDMRTAEEKPLGGIVRFDKKHESFVRIAPEADFIDVNIGLDQMGYALSDQYLIYVFNPINLEIVDKIQLPMGLDFRAIAINHQSEIIAVTYDGKLCWFVDKCLRKIQTLPIGMLGDIDISEEGTLAIGSSNGKLLISNSPNKFDLIDLGTSPIFCAFGKSQSGN